MKTEYRKTTYTIKQILTTNHAWLKFYKKHKKNLRKDILECIVKLLSCRTKARGYQEYKCSNSDCPHIKRIFFTCKSRACSSCGKKATEAWIEKQNNILPRTSWQHITFTMPSILWDMFWLNRSLFNPIAKFAAGCVKTLAKKKLILPAIFIAIHSFGRDLKRNVHIHLSTTTGGLTPDGKWKKAFFHQNTLMKMWRYEILNMFRKAYNEGTLILTESIKKQLNHTFTFNHFLNKLYNKNWIVHCSKASTDHKQNVSYLGRYIKRPAIAESKLRHYDGNEVTFNYLNHTSNKYQKYTLSVEQFIGKFVQHIPDKGFRLIRYFGILANRVRGKLLPIVYRLLGQTEKKEVSENKKRIVTTITHATLMIKSFGVDPLTCILCGAQLIFSSIQSGLTKVSDLIDAHHRLALLQRI